MVKWIFALLLAVLLVLALVYDTRFGAVGAFLLLAGLIYGYVQNRRSANPAEIARAERGARELREDIEEDNAAHHR